MASPDLASPDYEGIGHEPFLPQPVGAQRDRLACFPSPSSTGRAGLGLPRRSGTGIGQKETVLR